jgi:outer membrane protein assembly factor BamB
MKKVVMATVLAAAATAMADGFRGDGSGVYRDAKVSAAWNKDTRPLWQVKLPSWSNSSPVPAGDRLFVGCEPTLLVCLRTGDGTNLWQASLAYEETISDAEKKDLETQRQKEQALSAMRKGISDRLNEVSRQVQQAGARETFASQVAKLQEIGKSIDELQAKFEPTPLAEKYRMPPSHGGTGYSTPTAVSDGKSVWAHGGNGVLACYSLDGQRKWIRFVEKSSQGFGHSASPVLVDGKVVVAINGVHAFKADTGEPAWQTNSAARFGTPVVTSVGGKPVVITANGEIIRASDGRILASKLGGLSFNGPVVSDGVVFFANDNEVRAHRLPAEMADTLAVSQVWKAPAPGGRSYASPVCHGGLLYVMSDSGKMFILDAATGEKVKEVALQLQGTCYSSPAIAGNALIVASEGGSVAAFEAGRDCKETGRLKVDGLRSSPSIDGDRLYLRTMGGVSCFGLGGN